MGGLDLTGGRYDTPCHPLYSTLLNEHYGDFRNSNAKSVPPEQGPREPWHDIHSKVRALFELFVAEVNSVKAAGTRILRAMTVVLWI